MIAAATALIALAIVLHDRRARTNRVTSQSRHKRVERTWSALANEASTVGDNDRTTCLPVYTAARANAQLTGPWWRGN